MGWGNGAQGRFALPDLDGLAGLHGAVAVPVGHHQCAAALDQLGEVRVVVLAAGQQHLAAVGGLGVRLAGAQLLQRLPQLVDDEVLGTGQRHQIDHMELVPGDGGVVQLAVVSDLLHDAAQLVVALDGLENGLVRRVHAVVIVEEIHHMRLQLRLVVVDAVGGLFEGHVGELALELLVLDDIHPLQMLLEPTGDSTRLRGQLRIQEVEAALQRPLQQAASVVTGTGRHVVGCHVRRGTAGSAQTHRDAAGQIQQHLRHKVAGIAQRQLSVTFRLLDQIVVGLLKQVLEVNQVFQVPPLSSSLLRGSRSYIQ